MAQNRFVLIALFVFVSLLITVCSSDLPGLMWVCSLDEYNSDSNDIAYCTMQTEYIREIRANKFNACLGPLPEQPTLVITHWQHGHFRMFRETIYQEIFDKAVVCS